jgi:hypothetical protein
MVLLGKLVANHQCTTCLWAVNIVPHYPHHPREIGQCMLPKQFIYHILIALTM